MAKHSTKPDPEFVAQQLRKPSGDFAEKIAVTMDQVNGPLFDLALETMNLNDGESVLEIGFGSGTFYDKLFQQAEQLQICGIDYSREMVDKAKALNEKFVNSNQLSLKKASSNDIPFPSNSFDKVFCNMVVYFWDQPKKHLKEIKRVLKPNGKFFTGIRTRESMQKLPFIEYGFNLYGQDQWSSVLTKNGFNIVSIENKTDPEMEIAGQQMRMKSICIVAENNVG